MRKVLIILAVLLTACHFPTSSGSGGKAHHLVSANVSGAKGLFLAGSSVSAQASMSNARAIVSGSSANLQQIAASGQPAAVEFTDDSGVQISVTVTQAVQLNPQYVLFSYTSAEGNGTASMNLSTGALASISPVPDNWALIFTRGQNAYYEAGGSIWQTDLGSGVDKTVIGYGTLYAGTVVSQSSYPWDSSTTWVFSDSSGRVFAFDLTSSGYISASYFDGSNQIDFGSQQGVSGTSISPYTWSTYLPISVVSNHYWPIVDPATGNLYLLENYDDYAHMNGSSPGVGFQIVPVTMDPSVPGVVVIGTTPIAQGVVTAGYYGTTNIQGQTDFTRTIFSNGGQTWQVASDGAGSLTLSSWDTSAVPQVTPASGRVTNWVWTSGAIFAGPTATNTGISLATLNADGSVTDPEVVPSGVTSWSVVGGVLFYTTAEGTFQAAVNTQTLTIGTPTPYTGGQVAAVTQ